MENVLIFLNSLDLKGETLVVACSGGSDSMFLLNLLNNLGYKVICAHVNHKVRPESDSEYKFVQDYCNQHKIIFEGTQLTGYGSGNFEHFARNFRYSFFESILKKYNSSYLFTAHHGDDLIETIMMRMVRGSSLKGYKGFSKVSKRNNYYVIRPLIYLTKDFIENELNNKNVKYVVDNSNFSDDYTRNRFRHHILPILKDEDCLVHERFLHFSEELDDVYNYISRVTDNKKKEMFVDNILDINKYNKEDIFIKKNIINSILSDMYPDNLYLINNNHINEIMKIINSNKKNIQMSLPNDILLSKEYDKLIFNKVQNDNTCYDYLLVDGLEIGEYVFKFGDTKSSTNNVIRLNSKDIKLPLRVRTRNNSDKMRVKNLNGSKKVNDIFIDNKITLDKRNSWPIVVDSDNNILWLPGLKKSDFDVEKNSNYDIIIEYLKKGEKDL